MEIEDFPESIKDWTNDDIQKASQFDFPRADLDGEVAQELFWVRISGLDSLRTCKKEFNLVTEEDMEWYQEDATKKLYYEPKMDEKIMNEVGWEEAKEYFKECGRKERAEIERYIEDNKDLLFSNYPIYVTSWFGLWYQFWRESDANETKFDWSIFFSLLNPKPPDRPKVQICRVLSRFYTIQKAIYKPALIKYIWNTPELRERTLKGDPLPYQWEIICSYSTIYSSIRAAAQVAEKRKEAGRDMSRGPNKKMKVLLPIFRQVLQAQKEGKEVAIDLPDGKAYTFPTFSPS